MARIIKYTCDIANCDNEAKEFKNGEISIINKTHVLSFQRPESIITDRLDICKSCLEEIVTKRIIPVRETARVEQREIFNYFIK
jgi:hypothetical protein